MFWSDNTHQSSAANSETQHHTKWPTPRSRSLGRQLSPHIESHIYSNLLAERKTTTPCQRFLWGVISSMQTTHQDLNRFEGHQLCPLILSSPVVPIVVGWVGFPGRLQFPVGLHQLAEFQLNGWQQLLSPFSVNTISSQKRRYCRASILSLHALCYAQQSLCMHAHVHANSYIYFMVMVKTKAPQTSNLDAYRAEVSTLPHKWYISAILTNHRTPTESHLEIDQ